MDVSWNFSYFYQEKELTKVLLDKKNALDLNIEYVKAKERELTQKIKEIDDQKEKSEKRQKEINEKNHELANLNEALLSKELAFKNIDEVFW